MKDFYLLLMVFGVIVCLPYRLMISTMIMPIAPLRVRKFSLEGAKAGVGRGLAASEHARGGTGDDVAACFAELLKPGKLSHRHAEFISCSSIRWHRYRYYSLFITFSDSE